MWVLVRKPLVGRLNQGWGREICGLTVGYFGDFLRFKGILKRNFRFNCVFSSQGDAEENTGAEFTKDAGTLGDSHVWKVVCKIIIESFDNMIVSNHKCLNSADYFDTYIFTERRKESFAADPVTSLTDNTRFNVGRASKIRILRYFRKDLFDE